MTQPTKKHINDAVDEMVECLFKEAEAKAANADIIAAFKEKFPDFDTSWLTEAAKKQYKKETNPDSYERERIKREAAYAIVDNLEEEEEVAADGEG